MGSGMGLAIGFWFLVFGFWFLVFKAFKYECFFSINIYAARYKPIRVPRLAQPTPTKANGQKKAPECKSLRGFRNQLSMC
jgi:hypothetical protein